MTQKEKRAYSNVTMGSAAGDLWRNLFTKENIQTGVQVAANAVNSANNGGTVTYGGTTAQISPSSGTTDYTNYMIIGAIGLAAVYLMKKK